MVPSSRKQKKIKQKSFQHDTRVMLLERSSSSSPLEEKKKRSTCESSSHNLLPFYTTCIAANQGSKVCLCVSVFLSVNVGLWEFFPESLPLTTWESLPRHTWNSHVGCGTFPNSTVSSFEALLPLPPTRCFTVMMRIIEKFYLQCTWKM